MQFHSLDSSVRPSKKSGRELAHFRNRLLTVAQHDSDLASHTAFHSENLTVMHQALDTICASLEQGRKDSLTGLANRAAFEEAMIQVDRRTARTQSLIYIDLDHFKKINDQYGHGAADEILQIISMRIKENCSVGDLVARLGGDEFVVLPDPTADEDRVVALAMQITDSLCASANIQAANLALSASIGVTIAEPGSLTAGELMRQADFAMYAAKRAGRGRCSFYEAGMLEALERRKLLARDLVVARESGAMSLVYQPIVDTVKDKNLCHEVFVQWEHPLLGMINSQEIYHLAMEAGQTVDLDWWILTVACTEAVLYPELGRISVVLSPYTFRDPDIVNKTRKILKDSELSPQRLLVATTESAIDTDLPTLHAVIGSFRAYGLGVTIHDFGGSLSSLRFLQSVPVSEVKLSEHYIDDLQNYDATRVVISGIIGICQELGVIVTAGGVNTSAQAYALASVGCVIQQGPWHSLKVAAYNISAVSSHR